MSLAVDSFLKGASFIRVHDVKALIMQLIYLKSQHLKNKKVILKYFGTDGIKIRANLREMNAALALKIGMASAKLFTKENKTLCIDW